MTLYTFKKAIHMSEYGHMGCMRGGGEMHLQTIFLFNLVVNMDFGPVTWNSLVHFHYQMTSIIKLIY